MKTCNRCGSTKPLDQYNKHNTNSDGKKGHCRSCEAVERKNRRAAEKVAGKKKAKEEFDIEKKFVTCMHDGCGETVGVYVQVGQDKLPRKACKNCKQNGPPSERGMAGIWAYKGAETARGASCGGTNQAVDLAITAYPTGGSMRGACR